MSNCMNVALFLSVIALNKLVTASVYFHSLSCSLSLSWLCLYYQVYAYLIFPISDFVELINRYDGLVLKFRL